MINEIDKSVKNSTCKFCHKTIPKDSDRVIKRYKSGWYNLTDFYHITCYYRKLKNEVDELVKKFGDKILINEI